MRYVSRVLITLSIAGWATVASNQAHAAGADLPGTTTQLPRTVRPTHYDVTLTPDAASLSFTGKVAIAIDVLKTTNAITLHAVDMTFGTVTLLDAKSNAKFEQPIVTINDTDQTVTFKFAKPINAGSYKLAIDYQGKIGTQAYGLFAIDYDTKAGAKRALYTQFENSDARRMIPSWDEPAYKATFTLEANIPGNQMAVSNMPVAERIDVGGGRARVRFATSPKMSSYLLFFALGEFERATAKVGSTEVGVVVQKGAGSQAAFALQSSQAVLREYNEYFDIPYPLPKLDNVASPGKSQFFSAMENWGAIYTFEYSILLDPTISTQTDKQNAFSVAAHEIAHQWFGDLVTMSWWDDLWLNEGFASWMESRTTAKLHPEWNTWLSTVTDRESAMSRDALATTHPVVQHVETVEQASQAFDSITYQKGEAVIRMLERYVGEDAWRAGVRQYIKKNTYGNTVSDDLWKEIETAAKIPVTAIAHDFTLQPGVPLIRVGEPRCIAGNTTLQLTQGEFSKDQPNKKPLTWRVPVIVKAIDSKTPIRGIVTEGKGTIAIPGCGLTVVNADQSGYYRTLYSPGHFSELKKAYAKLAPIDQLGLFSDTFSMGLAGLQPMSATFDLAVAAPANADPKLWRSIASAFKSIDDYYPDGERRERFKAFANARLAPIFAAIGWTAKRGEADTIAVSRNELIETLGALDNKEVVAEAKRRYASSETHPDAIPAAIRKSVLAVVARHADSELWDQLRAAARAEKTPLVKDELYSLLAASKDKSLAQRALDLSLTSEPGATNSAEMIARVAANHPDLAFDFAVAHLTAVESKVGSTARLQYFPRLAAGSFDPKMPSKIDLYAKENVPENSRRDAETAKASVLYRIKVRNERLPSVDAWLAKQGT